MTHQVPHYDWQLLRILARAKNKAVRGQVLRHTPTRHSKDGQFLNDLVARGMIETVAEGEGVFDSTYALTDLGRRAAEYGEYEGPAPWEAE